MAIKQYDFNYDFFKYTTVVDADPAHLLNEMMKLYAIEIIKTAKEVGYDPKKVIEAFDDKPGFLKLDGSKGILLREIVEVVSEQEIGELEENLLNFRVIEH